MTDPPNGDVALSDPLLAMNGATRKWFSSAFSSATDAQRKAWPIIARGENTLVLAPTGSGKTLAAFLHAIDFAAFSVPIDAKPRVRVLYVSPLKALAVDVERNLKAPLAGISAVARQMSTPLRPVTVAMRTGDTPARERAQMGKHPPDILITTPESLYLMLTSQMRETLSDVRTVIVDEIHSLCGTKRGAHLALSLERLEHLRGDSAATPLQRIGLSATQRPLSEVAAFLGGFLVEQHPPASDVRAVRPRSVQIVDAGRKRPLELSVEVPVADMARPVSDTSEDSIPSIWPSIHPRLVELIRSHRSTMIFTNSRRLAERLATAINELAEEELALAHHGSVARDQRVVIEDRLKRGDLPAIVATSSLELGLDLGAVDLVIQIEAPPTVASGIQRIGRAGHHVGGTSKGIIFPKYRGDLLACAAATANMDAGLVESTHYVRNPIDVLAQHIVSICVVAEIERLQLLSLVRGAAPFAELSESNFDGVLDMLSGRYPSERFRELRARILWDRSSDTLSARKGARLLAVGNAGTITERGLYGVFLAGTEPRTRVGELDEEMVFETNPGDVFLLGASSWRAQEITHDAVYVVPAPGEPGRMPFWRGDRPGRPLEFGRAIGKLIRTLRGEDALAAQTRLTTEHHLDPSAAINLLAYLNEQEEVSDLPTDRRVVIECFVDEVGDWRVAVLSPFGGRVHAPWATVVTARLLEGLGIEADSMWTDDGMIFRLPDSDEMPDPAWFIIDSQTVREQVTAHISGTALFASHFRENAARALLLPRRRPGQRVPLWVQRRKSADLLHVAAGYPEFPIILETFRECLMDAFDLEGLVRILEEVESGSIRVTQTRTKSASPFAASLLFSYVGDFIYNGDAPLAERRAQALSLDHDQLRLLLGEPELREMLSGDAIDAVSQSLAWLDGERKLRDAEDLHRLLLEVGDLSEAEIALRPIHDTASETPHPLKTWLEQLERKTRLVQLRIAGEERYVAVEDCARFRDALGVVLPLGIPSAFLDAAEEPWSEIAYKYAKSHGPFSPDALARRYGVGVALAKTALDGLVREGVVFEGSFLPDGAGREYCEAQVLRRIKRASLATLRSQIEPVEREVYARFLLAHQFVSTKLRGLDGVLSVIAQVQGVFLPLRTWLQDVFPLRVRDFTRSDLDELCSAGEVLFQARGSGVDLRLAFFLTDDFPLLAEPVDAVPGEICAAVREALDGGAALFFVDLLARTGRGQPDLLRAVLEMMQAGELTNDTLLPLRTSTSAGQSQKRSPRTRSQFRSRRTAAPGAEGRWSLLPVIPAGDTPQRVQARANQMVQQHGVVTREAVRAAAPRGGFSAVYPMLKALEEAGKLRRGYFIEGLGATQFALPGAESRLRSYRLPDQDGAVLILAAQDPANPFGATLPWPELPGPKPARASKNAVVLLEGSLLAYSSADGRGLALNPQLDSAHLQQLLQALVAQFYELERKAWLLVRIDDQPAADSPHKSHFLAAGFEVSAKGLLLRRRLADAAMGKSGTKRTRTKEKDGEHTIRRA